MSFQTLYTAATGMNAQQLHLDAVANNLANANTTAFKRTSVNFEDLFYRNLKLPGSQDAQGNFTPTGIAIGAGTRVQSTATDFSQGDFNPTNGQFDIAISGKGFLQVQDPNTGLTLYTRAGNLSLNSNGQLVVNSAQVGRVLQPAISIPSDATNVVFGSDGKVQYQQFNTTTLTQAGNLQLANFINPEGLLKLGDNLFQQTDSSGPPLLANPGQNGAGTIQQNVLEASNVDPVTELVDLIATQRTFELNSQTLQAADQVLQLITNLRRY